MIVILKLGLVSVMIIVCARYLGQRSFDAKVVIETHRLSIHSLDQLLYQVQLSDL